MRCLPADNNYYQDQITGLIGMSGTHILSLFYTTVILLNYMCVLKEGKNKKSVGWLVFNLLSSIIIALFNDNKSYYILLVMAIILIIAIKIINKEMNKKRIITIVLSLLTMIGILFLIQISNLNTDSNNRITYYINSITNIGASERTKLFNYALDKGNGYGIGNGIGSIQDYGDPNLPKHFGINNLSSLTYQGGITYLFLVIIGFFIVYYKMSKIKNYKYGFLIFAFLILLCYYTQPFSESYLTFFISLIFMCIGEIYTLTNSKVTEKEK
jgi:hypothetical protein